VDAAQEQEREREREGGGGWGEGGKRTRSQDATDWRFATWSIAAPRACRDSIRMGERTRLRCSDCVAASARDRPETEGPALSENAVSPLEVSLTRPNNSRA